MLTPEATSLTDAYAMIKVLAAKNSASDFLVLVNQVKNREEARQTFSRLDNAVRKFLGFGTTFLGMVQKDPNMSLAVLRQQPLVRLAGQSPAARDIRIVAQRIQSLRNALLPEIACAPAIKIFNAHPMKISR